MSRRRAVVLSITRRHAMRRTSMPMAVALVHVIVDQSRRTIVGRRDRGEIPGESAD